MLFSFEWPTWFKIQSTKGRPYFRRFMHQHKSSMKNEMSSLKMKKCTLFPLRRCCPFFLKYGLKSSMLSYSSFSPSSFCNSNTSFIFFKIQAIISLFWFKWPTQFKIWGTEKTYVILQPLSTHLPATTTPVSILQNHGNQLFFKECLYVRKNKAST